MAAPPWNPDHPLIGRLLQNRYQIASFIREGGMAQVFCAVQNAEPRHCAIKVIHPELAEDPEIVARFVRESRTAARLQHPNIVRILSVSEDRALLFIAMELLFGDDLSARVKLKGSFTEERATEIIIDLCRALQHAHEQGVIHRDIKPENVMLARQPDAPEKEVVKVLDFGIAKILDERLDVELPSEAPTGVRSVLTRVGTWVGTPAYMSPEQGSAQALDHRSDIYSAGVLLYELVCGRLPFDGQTPLQILARHIHEALPLPSSFTTIHPGLEAVIVRALEKNRDNRFSSAREMGDALAQVLPDLAALSSERWIGRTMKSSPESRGAVSSTLQSEEPATGRAWTRPSPAGASPSAEAGTRPLPAGSPTPRSVDRTMPSQKADDGSAEPAEPGERDSLRGLKQTMMIKLPARDLEPAARQAPASALPPSPKVAHPLIGRLLLERYQVASFIRQGSMAQVFCGLQDDKPRHVAIKVVDPELAADPGIVARFLQEGQLAARLRHPNIVRIVDVGEDEDLLFMVMELLFGDDLSARIKQRGSLDQSRAIQIAIDTCRALAHAHAHGIVHRDIKPENIMLCRMPDAPEREVVKVLDFGIAKVLDAKNDASLPTESPTAVRSVLTRVGSLVGTPAYMSPEQGRAEPVDHRSDIYSVGVLLFELLCGKPPFEGETPLQIVARHVHQPPPAPSSLVAMPRELEAIVLRALAKDPAHRHQSAGELADALEALSRAVDRGTGSGAASDRWLRHSGRVEGLASAAQRDAAQQPTPRQTTAQQVTAQQVPAPQTAAQPRTAQLAAPHANPPHAVAPPKALQPTAVGSSASVIAAPAAAGGQVDIKARASYVDGALPKIEMASPPPQVSGPAALARRSPDMGMHGLVASVDVQPSHMQVSSPPQGGLHSVSPAQGMAALPQRPVRVGGLTQPLHSMGAALAQARPPMAHPSSIGIAPPPARDPRAERLVRIVAVLVVLLGVAVAVILALVLRPV